ncbi:MAG: DUF4097 domain-containing protein [Treponema sp.]|nr:DUF4097 domain-containing protein [Treponema sp.]
MKIKELILVTFMLIGCLVNLSADGFSETKKIKPANVTNIEVELVFENLTLSTWKGNEIIIVSESNKKDIFPEVKSENKNLKILSPNSISFAESKEFFCNISLMLPENYLAEKIAIKAPYGKLDVQKLNAKKVSITPSPENSLANITTDYFEIPLPDQLDVNISNLDCKAFNITLLAGDANISLAHAPEKDSKLSVKDGKLNVTIPANSKFTLNAISYHSKFINNFTGDVKTWARDGITYKHKGGGSTIELRTFTGDITVGDQ